MMLYLLFVLFICSDLSLEYNDRDSKEESWDYDEDLNLVGLQEDDREVIYRPCKLQDLRCIRKFFAKNSQCSVAKGPAPDPLILDRNTQYLPLVNVTIVLNNVQISGLNQAKVMDFYVNKYTGNVVLAFNIYGLSERATYTSFRYKRTKREPIVLTDFTTVTYQELRYTAVIPKIPNLQLHMADIHVDIPNSNPLFTVGPKAYNNTDPDVVQAYTTLIVELPRILRENFLLKTSLQVTTFIQHNICNFGQKVISV